MKGRNWKSSSPHTPWLPAGSMRYTSWILRISSMYLDDGREGEETQRVKDVCLSACLYTQLCQDSLVVPMEVTCTI